MATHVSSSTSNVVQIRGQKRLAGYSSLQSVCMGGRVEVGGILGRRTTKWKGCLSPSGVKHIVRISGEGAFVVDLDESIDGIPHCTDPCTISASSGCGGTFEKTRWKPSARYLCI